MKKIRYNCFETNSSSTHAICIHKQSELKIPNYIYFGLEDLDNYNDYDSLQERANYLNTIMYECLSKTSYINKQKEINEMLKHYGIKIEWAKATWNDAGQPDYDLYSIKDSCTSVIIDTITENELLLVQYLFGENSKIIAGYEDEFFDALDKYKKKYPEGEEYSYYEETY